MEELKLVTIYAASGMLTAQVIKGKLASAGIPALLAYESLGPIYGLTVDGLGMVRVQVPERYAADARALIAGEEDAAEDLGDYADDDEGAPA